MVNCIWLLAAIAFIGNPSDRTILHFSSSNCPACRKIQPTIDQLNSEGWAIRSIDSARDTATADKWRVHQIPTLIVLENGREIDRVVGSLEQTELRRRLTGNSSHLDASNLSRNASKPSSQTGSNSAPYRPLGRVNLTPDYGPNHPLFKSNRTAESDVASSLGVNHPYYTHYRSSKIASRETRVLKEQPNRSTRRTPRKVDLPDSPISMSATVRIRNKFEQAEGVGTGTIIDSDANESIVLTCGHLFRQQEESSGIFVEIFLNDKVVELPAMLIDFRNDEVDLGIIRFRHPGPLSKVNLLPKSESLQEDQYVFSIGCDGGEDPSRRDTFITKLNRFLGPSNVEIAGAPVQGRSGGGLFDASGRLIGICIAADNDLDEGMFVGPEAIYDMLEKNKLNHLIK